MTILKNRLSLCFAVKERSRQLAGGKLLELFPRCIESVVRAAAPEIDLEVVVADFKSTDWPLADWLPSTAAPFQVEIVQATGNFSRGRGLNLAADRARGAILFFLDADMLVTAELLRRANEVTASGAAFFPVYQDLNAEGAVWRSRLDGYGALAVQKSTFLKAGKWPEFESWGGEDTILFERLQGTVPIVRHSIQGFVHQWHPEGPWKERFYLRPADADYFDYVKMHSA